MEKSNKLIAVRLDDETEKIVSELKKEGYSISGYVKVLLKKAYAEKMKNQNK